jgi:hypothetical protein
MRTAALPLAGASSLDLARTANGEHALARSSAESFLEHAIRCGEALLEAKQLVGHGDWLPWLNAHFNGSERIAQQYMRLAANPKRVADLPEPSLRKAIAAVSGQSTAELMGSSESNEWYTPSAYVEIVRAFLGAIDLDPASIAKANETVRAAAYWTREGDGLSHRWYGRVFCNPPYGTEGPPFVVKALEREADEVVLLLNAYSTETLWFQPLFDWPICYVRRRIPFLRPDGTTGSPPFGSCLVYIGPRRGAFARHFDPAVGAVVSRFPLEDAG